MATRKLYVATAFLIDENGRSSDAFCETDGPSYGDALRALAHGIDRDLPLVDTPPEYIDISVEAI